MADRLFLKEYAANLKKKASRVRGLADKINSIVALCEKMDKIEEKGGIAVSGINLEKTPSTTIGADILTDADRQRIADILKDALIAKLEPIQEELNGILKGNGDDIE